MTHDDPSFVGLKTCGHCSGGSAEPDYVGPPCPHCENTGLTDDLRAYGYCEGGYVRMSGCCDCRQRLYDIDKYARRCKACALKLKEESMAKIPEPSEEHLEAAAKTQFMLRLLHVAEAFGIAGTKGPFTASLPGVFPGWVEEKNGYRQISILAGTRWDVTKVTLAKKKGIMFCFKPLDTRPSADKDWPVHIEMTWDDVINTFGDLADAIDANLVLQNRVEVAPTNAQLKEAIARNAAMHKVLVGGFERAHVAAVEKAETDRVESTPGWGSW